MLLISHNLDKRNPNQLKTVALVLESVYNRVHKRKTRFLDQILDQGRIHGEQEQLVLAESIRLMTDSFQSEIKQDFVLCLQEVDANIASFVENTLNSTLYCQKSLSLPESNSYNLTVSNQSILYCHQFYLSQQDNQSLWAKKQTRIKPRQAVFCDFDLHFKNINKTLRVRVFNIHLEVYCTPRDRIDQLNSVWQNINTKPGDNHQKDSLQGQDCDNSLSQTSDYKNPEYFIIAGDWNTFNYFPLSLLVGWAFNYNLDDYFVDEKVSIKKWLEDKNLVDFFDGKTTYPRFNVGLDRIVISQNLISAVSNPNGPNYNALASSSLKDSNSKNPDSATSNPTKSKLVNSDLKMSKPADSKSTASENKKLQVQSTQSQSTQTQNTQTAQIHREIIQDTFGSDHYPIFVHISDPL